MKLVVILGIILVVLSLLGFGGVSPGLRRSAWPLLAVGVVLVTAALIL